MWRRQRKRVSEKQGPISTASFLTLLSPPFSFLSPPFPFISIRSFILPQSPEEVSGAQPPSSGLHQREMAPRSGTEQTSPRDCETHLRAFASRSCPQTILQMELELSLFFVLNYLFLVVLGLHCFLQAFSSCDEWGLCLVAEL